jgi:hypothetical protein
MEHRWEVGCPSRGPEAELGGWKAEGPHPILGRPRRLALNK